MEECYFKCFKNDVILTFQRRITVFLFGILVNCSKIAPFLSVCNAFFKFLAGICKLIILHLLGLYFDKKSECSFFFHQTVRKLENVR